MSAPNRIGEWSERFRKAPLARSVVSGLDSRSGEIWQRTFELLRRESPEYRSSVDEEFTKESQSHCKELLKTITAIAAGRGRRAAGDAFDFVREHAQWRARRQVPLVASLHAYRLAHKTYWGITREALLRHREREEALQSVAMLSDFWMEFFDYVGSVLADAHAVEEGRSAARNSRAYVRLMDGLLRGTEPGDVEARRLATLCGMRAGAPMAVAVARALPSDPGKQTDREVWLRSMVRLFEEVLPSGSFGRLVGLRNEEVTAIVCSSGDTGRVLLKALRKQGLGRRAGDGTGAGVGVSLDTVEVAGLPEAWKEARLAREFAGPERPLVHFADIDLTEYLVRRADATALRLIPEWTRHFTTERDARAGELRRTIRAFAECSLNVKQTALQLEVHTNTVYFRLNRIHQLTGVDPRTFSGASLLLTALRLEEAQRATGAGTLGNGNPHAG